MSRTVEDVVEFMLAGANAVAIGTATFANPLASLEMVEALPRWCAARGIKAARKLTGALRVE